MVPRLLRGCALLTLSVAILPSKDAKQTNPALAEVVVETAFGGVAFFQARVNSIGPLQFLLNTGSARCSLAEDVANQLGAKSTSGSSSHAGNAAIDAGVIRGATIAIGSASYSPEKMMVVPLGQLEPVFGRRIDGILGGDWMQQYVVELDYDANRLRLYDPKDFKYTGRGGSLPLAVIRGIPFVDSRITLPNGKSLWGHFLVDSAGAVAVDVYSSIAARGGLAEGLKMIEERGQGAAGSSLIFALRGAEFEIGKFNLKKPVVVIPRDEPGIKVDATSSGILGMDVLRRFKITFDYSRGRVYLEPNRRLHEPFVYDTTGMGLIAAPPEFTKLTVSHVKEASPARAAGLQPGDQLLEIDGKDLAGMSLEAVRLILRPAGQTHRLKVSRAGETKNVELHSREMLP